MSKFRFDFGGAVFLLKNATQAGVPEVPQVYYERGQTVYVYPGTGEWEERFGRYKLAEYLVNPDFWEAARSAEALRQAISSKDGKAIIAVKRSAQGYGDVIMSTTLLKALKEIFDNPDDVKIIYFTTKENGELLKTCPVVDKIRYDLSNFDTYECSMKLDLNNLEFKHQPTPDELRTGYRENSIDRLLRNFGLWIVDKTPVYIVSEEERQWAEREVENLQRPIIGVQCSASVKAKTYPRMASLINRLKELGSVIVLDEHKNYVYKYSVREMAALIEQCDLVVSNDSIAYHLAGAMKKRGVALFGYTDGKIFCEDYEKIVPVQGKCIKGDSPCWWKIECLPGNTTRQKEIVDYAPCIASISEEEVIKVVEEQLQPKEKVFCLMLTYNLLNMTKKAIASIRSIYDYQIFVVDNESTDGTQEWLKEKGIPFVSKKSGVAEAINIGLKEFLKTDCKYFLLLNNDIVLRYDTIERLIAFHKRKPEAWGIAAYTPDKTPPWGLDKATFGTDQNVVDIAPSAYSCTLFPRECIETVGLFDERFRPRYIEDNDYTLRIRLAGKEFWVCGDALFYHVLGAVMHTDELEKKAMQSKHWHTNIQLYIDKWGLHPHEPQILGKINKNLVDKNTLQYRLSMHKGNCKVVIKRLMGGLGDHLFLSVIAQAIKKHYPNVEVIYRVPEQYACVYKGMPYIDRVVCQDVKADYELDCIDADYKMEMWEMRKYNRIVTPRHKIYLEYAGFFGEDEIVPQYFIQPDELKRIEKKYPRNDKKRIAISRKTSNILKTWCYWHELIDMLNAEGYEIVDLDEGDFRDACALASTADLIVTGDSAFANIGGALKKKTVVLYGYRRGDIFKKMFDSIIPVQGFCPYRAVQDGCDYEVSCIEGKDHREKETQIVAPCLQKLNAATVMSVIREVIK